MAIKFSRALESLGRLVKHEFFWSSGSEVGFQNFLMALVWVSLTAIPPIETLSAPRPQPPPPLSFDKFSLGLKDYQCWTHPTISSFFPYIFWIWPSFLFFLLTICSWNVTAGFYPALPISAISSPSYKVYFKPDPLFWASKYVGSLLSLELP